MKRKVIIILFLTIFSNYSLSNQNQLNISELVYQLNKIATYAVESNKAKYDGNIKIAASKLKWDWGEGVMMFGLANANRILQDEVITEFITYWLNSHIKKGIKFKDVDHIAPTSVIAEMKIQGLLIQDNYKNVLNDSYDFLITVKNSELIIPLNDNENVKLQWRGRPWLDDLFMTVPFMIRYDLLNTDIDLTEKITNQFEAYQIILQNIPTNSETNLFQHGKRFFKDYKFDFWLPTGKIAWARGHGWYIAALADFLVHLSVDDSGFEFLINHYKTLLDQILTYQLNSGLFPTILNDSTSYGEVSATALIMYATATGIKQKWLERDDYLQTLNRGVAAILNNIDTHGKVLNTSAGTGAYPFSLYYKMVPRDSYPWGYGSVLMALTVVVELLMGD